MFTLNEVTLLKYQNQFILNSSETIQIPITININPKNFHADNDSFMKINVATFIKIKVVPIKTGYAIFNFSTEIIRNHINAAIKYKIKPLVNKGFNSSLKKLNIRLIGSLKTNPPAFSTPTLSSKFAKVVIRAVIKVKIHPKVESPIVKLFILISLNFLI